MIFGYTFMWFEFIFCSKWIETIDTMEITIILMEFFVIIYIGFSQQGNVFFHRL